jgi:hypothetical protein
MSKNTRKPKPAKKTAASKPKLIEGKYSHKFLTRLEPDSGKKLEALLDLTGNKTYNGAVRYVVENYERIVKELHKTQEELAVSRANGKQYQDAIGRFTAAFQALSHVKPVKRVQTSLLDEIEEEA